MRSTNKEQVKVRNWQSLSSLAVVAVLIAVAIFAYYYLSSKQDLGDFTVINSRSQNMQSDYVDSNYVKENRYQFEQKQAARAAKQGRSHITIGSINDIKAVKPKPRKVIDAYKKPESFSKRLKERNQQQRAENAPNKSKEKVNNTDSIELSDAFKTALGDLLKDNNKSTYDQQKIQTVTVTTADYYSQSIKAIAKPVKDNIPVKKISAGTTLYALIVNTVNSDFIGTPVVAKIEIGEYRGAYLLGKFATDNQWAKGISITFTKFIYNDQEFKINAIATNADYQPNLYDDIDNHWFQRIGGSLVGSALGGVKGVAKQYDGSNQTVVLTNGGGSTQYGSKPDSKQLAIGFAGGAASDLSNQLEPTFKNMWNRPSTVTVNAGHAIGVLFTATIELSKQAKEQRNQNNQNNQSK